MGRMAQSNMTLEEVDNVVSRVQVMFKKVSDGGYLGDVNFAQWHEAIELKWSLLRVEREKIKDWSDKITRVKDETNSMIQQNNDIKSKCSSTQLEHYSIVSVAREIEQTNKDIEKERNATLKHIEVTQNTLMSDMEKLNAIKNDNYQLEKRSRKIQSDYNEVRVKLEGEQQNLSTKKQSLLDQVAEQVDLKCKAIENVAQLEVYIYKITTQHILPCQA